jgi:FkbM family methyltransferase
MAQPVLAFDRRTGVLDGATAAERLAAVAFQTGARLSSAWSYRGFGAGCKAVRTILQERDIIIRLDDDALFSFPYGDGYWTLLLDRNYQYEADLELFFRGVADADYTLIDCGANFGYWSVLVTSKPFGAHRSVAIEPSSRTFAKLSANAKINGNRFKAMQRAIGAKAGIARLSGAKHEQLSIAGPAGQAGEEVAVIALDDLVDQTVITALGSYVIKLDVEGVEIEALNGATRLLQSDCVVICEDHGSDRDHTISRHILSKTDHKLFCYDPDTLHFEHLRDVSALDRIKKARNIGYNVFSTKSAFWEQRLRSLSGDISRADR